ncbi:hypothetical protein PV327_007295 [Microctonus hyperodae]|uniref:Deoxyuridine 5'-triphosphate nucleotidohydrolase n=1 Tax=Microctonus hyperodae TaxID=165561 RepID=A0AA39KJH5_MICHY|nr:hypothetical protein PV327_007295 [Microctonus hyperodae]
MPSNTQCILKFSKLTDKAFPPVKSSALAAGYDLRSAYEYCIPPEGKALIKTDLQIKVPDGTYGRIAPRSGLAWKHFINVGAGVIDADYRPFPIAPGDRVAQLICEKIEYPMIEEVETLDDTQRGSGGFGSTGVQ